ncbi:MAG: hypothetical protein OEZ06_21120 [Myxococcales bacterium]|nr:hypothetical protein [Myxococcales bacterium]
MATPSKKPRDIKNLKARLGRTVTPGQSGIGGPAAAPPGGSVPPGGLPLPGATPAPGGLPAPALGGLPAPAIGGTPAGIPGAVAAPPFAQPAAPAAQPAAPAAKPAAASPFEVAAAPAFTEKKVTLVIDDSAVKDDEVGRKAKSRNLILVSVGLVVGFVVGFGIFSTSADRKQFTMAVADGVDIYNKVQEVSKILDAANSELKKVTAATAGGPGKAAQVDYKAIETLVAMERPFGANEFSRRRYLAFPTNTVDDLFEYYNGINLLWDKFALLGAKTAGKTKREALDKSAAATDELLTTQYGVVVSKVGEALAGGIVIVKPKPPEPGVEPEEGAAPVMLVSSKDGGREVERTAYIGQEDFAEKYGNYVLVVDKARSMGTLGAQASIFGDLRGEIVATTGLMGRTVEVQGRLLQALGKVAALKQ